jgi:hypothetical protein
MTCVALWWCGVVVVVVGARLRLDSGRRLPWDPGEGVAQRLSGSVVTLSIVIVSNLMKAWEKLPNRELCVMSKDVKVSIAEYGWS